MPQRSPKTAKYTFVDLFAGIGGFRIALESLGLRCVYSSEWDVHAQVTYRENFGEVPAGDITAVEAATIPAHNVLSAGFPCQAFSISGKQRGFADIRGTLFFDIVRIAEHHEPEVLFLENVSNFARHDKGRTLAVVTEKLEQLGYRVFYSVLNAGHYGIPQSRRRIYVVCFRSDLDVDDFRFPRPKHGPVKLRDFLEEDEQTQRYIVNHRETRLHLLPPEPDIFGHYPQKPIRIGTIGNGGQGERIYSDLGHAITLSAYGGGVASKTGAYLVNGKVRKLSPRECARIMGFPDTFKIPVTDSQAYKQFGNSVPIPVVRAIFSQVLPILHSREVSCRETD